MKRFSLFYALLLLPLLLCFFDVMFHFNGIRTAIEPEIFFIDQVFNQTRQQVMSPFQWITFQQDGMRKLADLELRYEQLVETLKPVEKTTDQQHAEDIVNTAFISSYLVYADKPLLYAGKDQHVDAGAAIVSHKALIGKVIASTGHLSSIELLPQFDTPLRVHALGASASGVLTINAKEMKIEHIDWQTPVAIGDIFITDGDAHGIPPGLPVAHVLKVLGKPSDPTQTVEADPLITLKQSEVVQVFMNH